jgi:TrmH family RNA methyltransferase
MELPPPITSRSNARVKALRAALSGRARKPGELAAIEGALLLREAVRSGVLLETVFVREGSDEFLHDPSLSGVRPPEFVLLSAGAFDSAMETETPQGIAATFTIPAAASIADGASFMLLLEAVQDPGNVGTLLRSAEAFGASAAMLTNDCANPWSPKALRASAGSVFRMPMVRGTLQELTVALHARGCRLLAAVAHGEDVVEVQRVDLNRPCAVLIGNEGAGLSPQAIAASDERVTIPCAIESLNAAVAGSTILYEAMRQRLAAEPSER